MKRTESEKEMRLTLREKYGEQREGDDQSRTRDEFNRE